MKKLIVILAILNSGCAVLMDQEPKYAFIERQKHIGVPSSNSSATAEDLAKKGFSAPNDSQNEALQRLHASCAMKCSTAMTAGGHVTYDNRLACKINCMRAEGWELTSIEEDQK